MPPSDASSNLIVLPGAYLDPAVQVGDGVRIGPNAVVLANEASGCTRIEFGAEIGANATICAGVTVGARSKVMPGAVVMRSVPPLAVVEGNPARITGYVDTTGIGLGNSSRSAFNTSTSAGSAVKGVSRHSFKLVPDMRGSLSVGEFSRDVPFSPLRYFLVFDVPSSETRGEHAHRQCKQFLVAVKGSLNVVVDDGTNREEFILDAPNVGLYLPPMVWGIQYRFTTDAILLVFASDYYDADDYIRDYLNFLQLVDAKKGGG